MTHFVVSWAIDIEAGDPVEAALRARGHQLRPDTTAVVFRVRAADGSCQDVDLDELAESVETGE